MLQRRVICTLLCLAGFLGSAQAVTFNNVVSLGDSLLDDSGGGRSPVAAEHVADRLSAPLTKFAQSGATSDDMITSGQHTQAASLFGVGDLAMIWIGGNDFFSSAFEIAFGSVDFLTTLEANTDTAISTLRNAGLDVTLFNLPDMAKVPGVIDTVNAATILTPFLRPFAFGNITDATIAWNNRLEALADQYDATLIDVFSLFNNLADDPSAFSLLGNDPILNTDTGCQFCVFFDDLLLPDVHPSSFAQGFIANQAIAMLNQQYDPNGSMPLEQLSIVDIAALASVIAGDFDNNQTIDGDDLTEWQDDFGNTGSDADGDGDTDGADFLVWQRNFTGNSLAISASSISVPEPHTLLLLFFWIIAIMNVRR